VGFKNWGNTISKFYTDRVRNTNADVLSRHVAATVQKQSKLSDKAEADVQPQAEASLTKEAIKQTQVSDEFCRQIDQALVEGKPVPYFKIKIRCYITNQQKRQMSRK
jgi:hypothetical protein